jgi:hypothetical protein
MVELMVMKSTILWDIIPCSSLKVSRRFGEACFHAGILLGLFDPEDGGDMFIGNVG